MEPDHLTTPRLEAWLARTQTPLDLLALLTIWLTVLPFTRATDTSELNWWVVGRVLLSSVYGIDVLVRSRLSARPWRYFASHPVAVAAVIIPTIRILFSIRLLSAMFRKGALGHFLFVAAMLILNAVILVYFFEDGAPGANITTFGDSLWWAAVTVATVGYGDYYPVTIGGRLTAVALMGVGLVTAAVITAQLASSFMDQSASRRALRAAEVDAGSDLATAALPSSAAGERPDEVGPDGSEERSLHARLDRIEALLVTRIQGVDVPPES